QVSINVVKVESNLPEGIIGISGNVLFRINPDGKNMSVLVDFSTKGVTSPVGRVLQGGNGKYYGLARYGGVNNYGALFEYDPVNGNYAKIADMNSIGGKNPNGTLIQSTLNGKIYGTCDGGLVATEGIIFEYDPSNGSVVRKKIFDSRESNSKFGYYSTIGPVGNLVEGPNAKKIIGVGRHHIYGYDVVGSFYNTSITMGNDKIIVDENAPRLPDPPSPSIILGSDGFLYGTTKFGGDGATFQLQRGTLFKANVTEGGVSAPQFFFSFTGSVLTGRPNDGGVTELNGKLYGTTTDGGEESSGELYEYDLVSKNMTKRADFQAAATGKYPSSSLTIVNGKLYGMAKLGGAYGYGTIFEFDPTTGNLKKIF
ncbi:MAG: choice-of-anchor tandem repeat GloVer-containing protein, partial [Flammeovirgaceae bacterium]